MRIVFCCFLLVALSGCAGGRHLAADQARDEQLASRGEEIQRLQAELASAREQLKEKDIQIQKLKEKLGTFGVF